MTMRDDILIEMADMALTIPDNEWDMGKWLCGSVGCVIGHGVKKLDLENRIGLTLTVMKSTIDDELIFGPILVGRSRGDGFFYWFSDIAESLGILEDEAEYLFGASAYFDGTSQKQVSERIRQFVKEKIHKDS
jgi:hypothetical protein